MGHPKRSILSRRRLLQGTATGLVGAAGAAVLAACGETQVVTKEVIKEVPVETIVTKEVVKEVPVEKIVTTEVVKEVEKVVVKEVVKEVTAAAAPIPEGPISGGTLTLSASRANTQDIFTQLRQVSSTQAFVTDYCFMPLWYGDTWGEGATPAMTGEWGQGVASSWETVEANRVYNFHLNPDVWWHDQTKAVDADDVLFGMEMAFDPAYGNRKASSDWGNIDGVKAWAENPTDSIADVAGVTVIDSRTVQIALEQPDPDWWAAGNKVFAMAKHHYAGLDKAVATEARAVDLLGNGPMIWNRYITQQFVDMAANKDFAYGAPHVDGYIVRYGDGEALNAATEANEQPNPIDFHRAAGGVEAFQRLASQSFLRPFPQRSPFATLFFLNQKAPSGIFDDVTLEQQSLVIEAMVRAIDRDTINAELYGGTRFISDYIFEHIAFLQDPPEGTYRDLSYNPDEARALLAEANWPADKAIQWMRWGPPGPPELAQQAMLAEVGITAEFMLIDGSAVIEKLYQERVHDMCQANMGGSQNAVDACLRVCSDKVYELGGWNHSNIDRPWIDEGYAEVFGAEPRSEDQRNKWLALAKRLHGKGDMVAGQLWRGSLLNLYHRRVKGAFWMQHYAIPVRSPINQVWIDPHWEERES
jgi:ABC-type transport system substrate-binding protein